MIKSILRYIISCAILFLIVHFSQEFILNQVDASIRFSLWDTNLFFAITTLLICVHFELFSLIKGLETQLGFIYMPTLFIKAGLFYLVFKSSIFSLEDLSFEERLNLLIPMFVFLALEVFFVVKIIRKTEA